MQVPIYYFTVEGISSSVFESQVYAYVTSLRANNIPVNLIIGQRYKARISLKKLLRLRGESNTQVMFLPQQLNYAKQAKRLAKQLPEKNLAVLHCRNIEAAYIGWLVQQQKENIRVLYDVRGYTEDENKYFGDQKGITKSERINEELFHAPIFFNFVSERLHTLYENKYQVEIVNYSICASAYNDTIFKPNLTKDIDASEKLKVVFVGGSQAYQKIESFVELLEEQSNVEFTVVTNKKVNIPKAKTTRFLSGLTPKEVSKLLDSMDYGILYRSNEAFNEVATPTKIAEYWGKGLKVIAINSAGAYTPIIKNNPFLGYVFKDEKTYLNSKLSKVKTVEKMKIAEFAKANYSLSANYMKYMLLYNSLINKAKEK